ncbi:MAG: hypothetical protein AAB426_05490, partial [Myxococcota bacterium]
MNRQQRTAARTLTLGTGLLLFGGCLLNFPSHANGPYKCTQPADCADGFHCEVAIAQCVETLSCALPLVQCGGACIDTTRTPTHCGGCYEACLAGQYCVDSACGPVTHGAFVYGTGNSGNEVYDVAANSTGSSSYVARVMDHDASDGYDPGGSIDHLQLAADGSTLASFLFDASSVGYSSLASVATLSNDDVIVAGAFSQQMVFDADVYTSTNTGLVLFVARYHPNGDAVWVKQFTAVTFGSVTVRQVAADAANVVVSGSIEGDYVFGGSTTDASAGSGFLLSILVSDGSAEWVRLIIPSADMPGSFVALTGVAT